MTRKKSEVFEVFKDKTSYWIKCKCLKCGNDSHSWYANFCRYCGTKLPIERGFIQ